MAEDRPKVFGGDIKIEPIPGIPQPAAGVASVVLSGFPDGTKLVVRNPDPVTFPPMAWTIGSTFEKLSFEGADIENLLRYLEIVSIPQSDKDFELDVVVSWTDDDGYTNASASYTHKVTVLAIADAPVISAQNLTVLEAGKGTLEIDVFKSPDDDNSEVLSLLLEVAKVDGAPIGKLSATSTDNVSFRRIGDGVYTLEATGVTAEERELTLQSYLGSTEGIVFTARKDLDGFFSNAIKVTAISTEEATGIDLAPNNNAEFATVDDSNTKIEERTAWISVTILPVSARYVRYICLSSGLSIHF